MTFEVYRSLDPNPKQAYRWRLVAKNGRVVADSGEGYSRKYDALRAITMIRADANGAQLVDLT